MAHLLTSVKCPQLGVVEQPGGDLDSGPSSATGFPHLTGLAHAACAFFFLQAEIKWEPWNFISHNTERWSLS